jgi:hypothetical protein
MPPADAGCPRRDAADVCARLGARVAVPIRYGFDGGWVSTTFRLRQRGTPEQAARPRAPDTTTVTLAPGQPLDLFRGGRVVGPGRTALERQHACHAAIRNECGIGRRTKGAVSCRSIAGNRLAVFGVSCEIEPEARHVKPVDITFRAGRFMCEREALLCVLPEFFRDCHDPPPCRQSAVD